ncbi:MAG: histidine phosphatase family protein, partial [Patescibacteria group bacterium]
MKIFLVRHGETTGDIEDRYGGWYDDHLTARGCAQLEATAARLIGKGVELIVSSSLIRAKEAAEIIAKVLSIPVEHVDGMRERNYGILSGLTKDEARERYPEVVVRH